MADTNDTIDGLLAEFRGYSAGMPASYHVTMSWADFRRMLDRFEAALGREAGDAAKLREALLECAQYIACVGGVGVGEVTINDNVHLKPEELTQKAIVALNAPPRNCDTISGEDPYKHQSKWCKAEARSVNPDQYCMNRSCIQCLFTWLFDPAQEGGAK